MNETERALVPQPDRHLASLNNLATRGLNQLAPRILRFPDDRKCGTVSYYDSNALGATEHDRVAARGTVLVPQGLFVNLSCLPSDPWGKIAGNAPDFLYLGELPDGLIFDLSLPAPTTDAQLRDVAHLYGLRRLWVSGDMVTASGLNRLSTLTALRSLYLQGLGDLEADALGFISNLHDLEDLCISGLVQDQHIFALSGLSQQLQVLDIWGTLLTDLGCEALASLDGLWELNLGWNEITDQGLRHLSGLHKLDSLILQGNRLTGIGLKNSPIMKHLTCLDLSETPCDDEALEALTAESALESLSLDGTLVTDDGMRWLARSNLQWVSLRNTAVTERGIGQLPESIGVEFLDSES